VKAPNPKDTATDSTGKPRSESEQLKTILAESGTSILEIQNAASVVRNDFAIGTPKYFFEKISFEAADPSKLKDQKLLEVNFEQQPLQATLHELSAISGLQLTIDVASISTAGLDVNPKIDLQIENETTANVIRKIAESAGLTAVESDFGFWITVKSVDEFETAELRVSLIVDDEQDSVQLMQLVRELVYPGTWKMNATDADIDPAKPQGTIAFADGKLNVHHAPAVIREVKELIDGIKASTGVTEKQSPLLAPVAWLDEGIFTKPIEPTNSVRVTIGQFMRQLNDNHGVQIMADWHTLGQTGWTSDSMAPGRIEERTVGDVVKEMAHGMRAFFYVVDEKTVWVTSPQRANNIFLLKLYPMEKLASGKLTKKRLVQILNDALGNQMNQPGVSFFLLAKQRLVVVRAPQSLHRQIRAVFEAIQ